MKTYIVDEDFIKEAYEAACPTWKAKLEQRFPELLKRYRLGDRFKYDGTEVPYILAQSEENRVILINLNTGNRYNDPVAVEDSESISKNEMQKIADGYLSRFRKES